MAKKILAVLLSLALLMSVLSVGVSASSDSIDLSDVTAFVFDGDSVTVKDGASTNYEIVVINSAGDEASADTEEDADGNIIYTVASDSDGQLQISISKKGGSYVLEGNGNGSITVAKSAAETNLYLNGVTLNADFTAAITVGKASSETLTITAVASTVNNLSDSEYDNDDVYTDNDMAENAVLKFKADTNVVITGSGTINIDANGKNAIKSNGLLTISEVTLDIDSLDNGISSEGEIVINSGNIDIKTYEGDGIKACADDSAAGDITINGGNFVIDAYADGIQATMNLTITGGTFDITTYGGYDAVYDGDDDSYPSAKGLKASGSYTVTADDGTETEVDATGCQLVISGGVFNLNCADDAIHSDGDVYITGGKFTINTGDDGIHSEYILVLGEEDGNDSDIKVSIENSYEGIEGASISLYSGTYKILSSDDCINAANADLTDYTFTMDIYGGNIYASTTEGDCFDSNGNLTIYGGNVVALGAINASDNEALDCDGTLTIKGGSVLSVQSSTNSMTRYYSEQAYAAWSSAGTVTATTGSSSSSIGGMIGNRPGSGGGSSGNFITDEVVLTIYDASSTAIYSVVVDWQGEWNNSLSYAVFSSDSLTSGEKYTLSVSNYISTTGITLSENEIEISTENTTHQLIATVLPTTASDKNLEWSSSDETVATVDDNGLVTYTGEGTAIITVTTVDGYSATCLVTASHKCIASELDVVDENPADCYTEGNITYYECSCGKLYSDADAKTEISPDDVRVNAFAHPADNVTYTPETAATHTEKGNIEYWTCSLCGDMFSDEECTVKVTDVVISETGHDDADAIIWTKDNENHSKVCSCGDVLVSEAHTFNWVVDTASNCTTAGVQHEECTVCGYVRNENTTVEKTEHVPEKIERIDSTCTEDGNIEYWRCSECGNLFSDEECTNEITNTDTVISSEGHSYSSVTISSTCTEQGYTTYTCDNCSDSYIDDYTDATGHDYVAVVTAPTATDYGYTTYTCSVCSDFYISDYIDPIGSEETVSVKGTVTSFLSETDEITITLTKSGESEASHSITVTGTSASYSIEGVENASYIVTVSKLNHVTRKYEITVEEDSVTCDLTICLIGDVNGDGKVNSIDVALANAHARGTITLEGYQLLCADTSGDGQVNTIDVARINAHAKGVRSLW